MKKTISWFGKLTGWVKTLVIVVVAVALFVVCWVVYKVIKNIMNGAKGLTDALGLSKSDSQQKAQDNQSKNYWNSTLADKFPNQVTLSDTQLKSAAGEIYDSWGFFSKNIEKTMNAFHKCNNKVDVSALCKAFSSAYGQDLLTYISPQTWTLSFRNYPKDFQFDIIDTFVNSLPND